LELLDEFLPVGKRPIPYRNRLGFFCRDRKPAIFSQDLLGILPPFLKFVVRKKVRCHHLLNLIWCDFPAEAGENQFKKSGNVVAGLHFQRLRIKRLSHQDMVFLQRLQRVGGIFELHHMLVLCLKIDDDLIQ
jgi:hypothetical protein